MSPDDVLDVIVFFPNEVLFAFPISPPFNDPPFVLGI
jgi:hypothetical protein